MLTQLRQLEVTRALRAEELAAVTTRLDAVTTKVTASEARVAELEKQRVARTPALEGRLEALYKRGGTDGYVRLLLATAEGRDLARASRGVVALARVEELRIAAHRKLLAEERTARDQLASEQRQVVRLRVEATTLDQAAKRAVADRTRLLDELDTRRELAAQYVGELEQARTRLQATMAGLATTEPHGPAAPGLSRATWPGRSAGPLLSRFGRAASSYGTAIQKNGIEIGTAVGTPVHAVHGGTVAYAAPFTGFGVLVILDHGDNTFTVYGHLAGTALRPGATVARGQAVGASGANPTGQPGRLLRGARRRPSGQSRTMAETHAMTNRVRAAVLAVSLPVLAFAVIGGFLGRDAAAQGGSYQHLKIFEDVVTLILNNYVEEVDIDRVMHGAMHGLADGLDPDSAYLDAQQMKDGRRAATGLADPGLELTRQYYLRVIAARDGSPAAKAGLMPGDYVRSIDGQSTRDTTVFEGMRLLRGKAGTKVKLAILRGNAAEPHEVELVREAAQPLAPKARALAGGTGYLRVPEFSEGHSRPRFVAKWPTLTKGGAARLVIDLRGTATGDLDFGYEAAKLFVPSGCSATVRHAVRRRCRCRRRPAMAR